MSAPAKFRKKPVEVEAKRFVFAEDAQTILEWVAENSEFVLQVQYVDDQIEKIGIETLEGVMIAERGDWVIKGVEGEFYPCKHSIFEKTYEVVND